MTITHITPRELALERENAKQLQTIRVQAVTVEAQAEELAALKAQPVQEPVAWQYRTGADWSDHWGGWLDCSKIVYEDYVRSPKVHAWSYETRVLYAAPVQPVQSPPPLKQVEPPSGFSLVCNRCGKWAEYCNCRPRTLEGAKP